LRFEDIFENKEIILEEYKIYKQPNVTEFDKLTKHRRVVSYNPKAFKTAMKDIIEDDTNYPTAQAKIAEITKKHPFWAKHINKIKKKV
jgi:hypothetical protein